MERSVSSGSLHIQKFQDILLADSYMCLPSDFPRPSNHMIAAIQSDKKGGSEKPFRESTWRKNLTGHDTPKKTFFLFNYLRLKFIADFVKWQHA